MITETDIDSLKFNLEELRDARGSDYSGVISLEKAIQDLTAQVQGMSVYSVNINAWIRVKLTQYGFDVYERYIRSSTPPFILERYGGYYKPIVDKEGCSKFQLWEFMKIFGEYFYLGNTDNIIDPMEIYIDRQEVSR